MPLSVVSVWRDQLKRHVQPGRLALFVHHGGSRLSAAAEAAKYDLVVSTYTLLATETVFDGAAKGDVPHTVMSDACRGKAHHQSVLQKVRWGRVVIDEAHCIRNRATATARAACALQADCRWASTGTPIWNKVSDLFSALKFLLLSPFDELKWFDRVVDRPIKMGEPVGLERLAGILSFACLRRTKDQRIGPDSRPLVDLPPRREFRVGVPLTARDQAADGELLASLRKSVR